MINWFQKYLGLFSFSLGGGSGGGDTTTVQKADPWSGVQPYITDYLRKGQDVTNSPYQFYNGDKIAGFSPEQEAGMNLNTQRALAGSQTLNSANQNITDTLNGNYLSPDSNPFLKGNVDQAMGDVQSRINSQFNNSNFGGSANQETLQRGLGEVANNMYGDNYSQERGRQLQASTQAPTLANADYMDGAALQGIGAQRQGLAQSYLNEASGQFDQANQFKFDQLNRYGDVVRAGQGVGGTTTVSADGGGSSPIAGALGGAATGYGIGNALGAGFGPWGAGAGALLGLLG